MTVIPRWYPQGIQQLVSKYDFPGGMYSWLLNSKCPDLPTFHFQGAGVTLDHWNSKYQKLPTKIQSPNTSDDFHWGGGDYTLDSHSREGHFAIFEQNFIPLKIFSLKLANASQIVSHILCTWTLIILVDRLFWMLIFLISMMLEI